MVDHEFKYSQDIQKKKDGGGNDFNSLPPFS